MIYFEDLWDLILTIAVPLEIVDCKGEVMAYYNNADAILQDFDLVEGHLVRNISMLKNKFQIMLNEELAHPHF